MEYLQLNISHKIFLVDPAQLDQLVYGNEIVAVDDLYRFQPVRDLCELYKMNQSQNIG